MPPVPTRSRARARTRRTWLVSVALAVAAMAAAAVAFACVPQPGRMTGGGSIFEDGVRITHGFALKCNTAQSPNRLEVNWGPGKRFHLTSLTTVFCFDDAATSPNPPAAGFDLYLGEGIGRYNNVPGATARWKLTDAGEPGTSDGFEILIRDAGGNIVLDARNCPNVWSCQTTHLLDRGNHQAHRP